MCGIFGVINFTGEPVSKDSIRNMSKHMIHRGPDDEGVLSFGSISIGMRRLSIIDISGGHQPISNESNDIHIVANGEIYNYVELRSELISRGHIFSTHSDIEVILHLYEEMGARCIEKLNGIFAIALYDQKADTLWLARDRLGVKPLFYQHSENYFIFSSDLTSLKSASDTRGLDLDSIVLYMGYSYIPGPKTIYKNIRKLMPSEQVIIRDKRVELSKYWSPKQVKPISISKENAVDHLRDLLLESVKLQSRSDVPIGVFLSGGMDSSAITALSAKISSTVNTFTVNFVGKGGEDAGFANLLAKNLGANHTNINVDFQKQVELLDELIPILDEPLADSSIIPTYAISKEARNNGIKVLLSGAGGDEVFGGYERHFSNKIGSAPWLSERKLLKELFCIATKNIRPDWRLRLKNQGRNFATMISGANLEFLRQLLIDSSYFDSLMQNFDLSFDGSIYNSPIKRMILDLENYLPNNILSLTDKATMASSIEGRVPLLDHRIVEFVYSLPNNVLLSNTNDKSLLKESLKYILPSSILYRKKEGFNSPINSWVSKEHKRIEEELLEGLASPLKSIFNFNTIQDWLNTDSKRAMSGQSLYSLYVLNKWIKTHE